MASTAEMFHRALAHQQAGRLADAAALYRQLLAVEPDHVDALHMFGLLAHRLGQFDMAIQHVSRAVALRPEQAPFHANLGELYRAAGKLGEAAESCRQAIRLNPQFAEAYNNLGNVLKQLGQLDDAASAYQQAIRLRPTYAAPRNNLGIVLRERGNPAAAAALHREVLQFDPQNLAAHENLGDAFKAQGNSAEAAEWLRRGIRLAPNYPEFHFKLGTLHLVEQQLDAAAACFREAVRLNPRHATAHHNLGVALKQQNRPEEALACYQMAASIRGNMAETHCALGLTYSQLGRTDEAADAFREAMRIRPDYVDVLLNYAQLIQKQGRLTEALACCQRVLALQPGSAEAFFRRAHVYQAMFRRDEAIADYESALRLKPDYVDAYNNLAVLCNDMAHSDAALAWCRKGLAVSPDFGPLYSNLAMALLHLGRGDEALAARRRAIELRPDDVREGSNYLYDLNFVGTSGDAEVFAAHLQWAARFAEPLTPLAVPHANDRDPERRLRVGYVSPYFRQHAVNYFVEPILTSHDHARFEIFCYSDATAPDEVTARVRPAADHWREVAYQSDEALVDRVRADAIDILVDLTGHIGGNRLLSFARKPAPIQVTYLGYQNTTGMSAMDYRLTDAWADPPGVTDAYYRERLVRLPQAFFCYRPDDDAPAVSPLPALERGYVTFGSFNNFAKVTPAVIVAWLQILARVPRSRLMVLAGRGGDVERRLRGLAAEQGIEPSRIELFDKRPRPEYMRLLAQADVALDPFPFNGHTTTCDAIWTGLPVVMLAGHDYVSRFGGSVLVNVGLSELIAGSVEAYVQRAVDLAGDLPRLAELRGALRLRMAASPLTDFTGFTRHLEQAYRQMWHTWLAAGHAGNPGAA